MSKDHQNKTAKTSTTDDLVGVPDVVSVVMSAVAADVREEWAGAAAARSTCT